ncbi:MAG: DVU_1553 family AMP-dependent CoA ligase [Desulfovibrionaceae bacterium]
MAGPLDLWLAECLGLPLRPGADATIDSAPAPAIDPGRLEAWRWERLVESVVRAKRLSPFYRHHLRGVDPAALRGPADLARVPRLEPEALRRAPDALLCASRDEIARVVTLQSSGTSGPSKRLFFTAGDIERTVHFFRRGMTPMVEPGRGALILLPGERPDSVGDQLARALEGLGVHPLAVGALADPAEAARLLLEHDCATLVAAPAHAQVLAAHWRAAGLPDPRLRAVLLCWDSLPDAVAATVRRVFGCRVLRHWGMVETGLGGAVECAEGSGLHLRGADLFLEVTDPATGEALPPGAWGELVVTTLRRRAMPLIRYRTGDLGRWLPGGPCPCGSPLPRLDARLRRLEEPTLPGGMGLADLSEVLYAVPGLADFAARLVPADSPGRAGAPPRLRLEICAATGHAADPGDAGAGGVLAAAREALTRLHPLASAVAHGRLGLDLTLRPGPGPALPGLAKRTILLEPQETP